MNSPNRCCLWPEKQRVRKVRNQEATREKSFGTTLRSFVRSKTVHISNLYKYLGIHYNIRYRRREKGVVTSILSEAQVTTFIWRHD